MIHFHDAQWFFALLLVPVFFRTWMRRNRPAAIQYSLPVPRVVSRFNPVQWSVGLRCAALVLLIVALARPQSPYPQSFRSVEGIDIMLTMDVSASMRIEDLADRSRFDVAKDVLRDFVRGRQNDRIGFAVFSGEAFTLVPPTLDYALILRSVQDVEIGDLKDGTAIGDGLAMAVSRLRNSVAKSQVIILLTDGENNVGKVDPITAGELAAGYHLRVYTIALGREGRAKLPIPHRNAFGKTVVTYQWFDNHLNTELLQQIAEKTEGKFYRVTDAATLEKVFKEIDRLEKSEVKAMDRIQYEELYLKPLLWAAVFLLMEALLATSWWRLVT